MLGDQAPRDAGCFGVVQGEGGRDECRYDAPTQVVDGDVRGHRDDAPGLTYLHIGRIQPEMGSVSLERSVEVLFGIFVDP